MRGRVLMTGKKDTKTGLGMLPLSMDEPSISPAATSTISQVELDVLQPNAAAAHQQLQDRTNLHVSASCRHENNVFFAWDSKYTFVSISPKHKKSIFQAGINIKFDANHKYGRIGKVPSSKCVLPAKIIIPPRNLQPAIHVLPRLDLPTNQQASPADCVLLTTHHFVGVSCGSCLSLYMAGDAC